MRRIYLDHQTDTPAREEVIAAMVPFHSAQHGSPNSLHAQGLQARDAIEKAREQVAGLVGAQSIEEIVFTSNGTEAINLAILGHCRATRRAGRHIVHSRIEHRAVLACIDALVQEGFQATAIPPDRQGFISPEAVREALRPDTILVVVHHANHEIGTIEPVAEIAAAAREREIPFCCDATASAGWLPLDVQASGISLLAISPHRFGGPKGVGVLYRNRRVALRPVLHGGDQEGGLRPGSQNVPAIVGAGVAAGLAARERPLLTPKTARLQEQLLQSLRQEIPHLRLHGPEPGVARLPNTLNLGVEFTDGEGLALLLDTRGVAIASGPVCSGRSQPVSHVLEAIGIDAPLARSGVILSLGRETTAAEVRRGAEKIVAAVAHLRSLSPAWDEFLGGGSQPRVLPPRRLSNAPSRTRSRTKRLRS